MPAFCSALLTFVTRGMGEEGVFSNEEGQGEDMPEAKGVKRKRAIDKVAAPNMAS